MYRAVPEGHWSFIWGLFSPNGIMGVAKQNDSPQEQISLLQQP